jgi:trans-L-3-hydroxyproline dehydratase
MMLTVVEMHTGGEPTRIVVDGWPPFEGKTLLDKRREAKERFDHLRRGLMLEPRGHDGMYGALLVEPDHPEADLAVLFMHNEGYSTMCGHATIALGRYAVDEGLVARQEPVTSVNIEAPCGLIVASVEVRDGKAGAVSFESVPAFLCPRPEVELPGYRVIGFDIAYGGAFYALADCRHPGSSSAAAGADFVDAGTALTES